MARVFGKDYGRRELGEMVGDLSQIAGMKSYQLMEGKGRGIRGIDVWTGSGFRFTILPDRGMDISEASYQGKSLCWRSPPGDVHPHFFESAGFGWVRSFFGGLLTTCGLTYCGAPCEDEGESLGLHGRISNTPAEIVSVRRRWEKDDYFLEIEGNLRETTVFGENLVLKRKIHTCLGESRLWIEDKVENQGYERSPLMLLYHINGGFPTISEGSRLISPTLKVTPRDEEAEKGREDYARFSAPIPNFKEKVYYHEMKKDESGLIHCALVNENLEGEGLGFYVTYKKSQLPHFIQWKMMGQRDYVVGMEPANCRVEGRAQERASGRLSFIEPGEELRFNLEIGVLKNQEEIKEFEKKTKVT